MLEKLSQDVVTLIIQCLWNFPTISVMRDWKLLSRRCLGNFPGYSNRSFWKFVLLHLDAIHGSGSLTKEFREVQWWFQNCLRFIPAKEITHLRFLGCEFCDSKLQLLMNWGSFSNLRKVENFSEEIEKNISQRCLVIILESSDRERQNFSNEKISISTSNPDSFSNDTLVYELSRLLTHDNDLLETQKYQAYIHKLRRVPEKEAVLLIQQYFREDNYFQLIYYSLQFADSYLSWNHCLLASPVITKAFGESFIQMLLRMVQNPYWRRLFAWRLTTAQRFVPLWLETKIPLNELFPDVSWVCRDCTRTEEACFYCFITAKYFHQDEKIDLIKVYEEFGYRCDYAQWEKIVMDTWWPCCTELREKLDVETEFRTLIQNPIQNPERLAILTLVENCKFFRICMPKICEPEEVQRLIKTRHRSSDDTYRYQALLFLGYDLNHILDF